MTRQIYPHLKRAEVYTRFLFLSSYSTTIRAFQKGSSSLHTSYNRRCLKTNFVLRAKADFTCQPDPFLKPLSSQTCVEGSSTGSNPKKIYPYRRQKHRHQGGCENFHFRVFAKILRIYQIRVFAKIAQNYQFCVSRNFSSVSRNFSRNTKLIFRRIFLEISIELREIRNRKPL